VKTRITAIANQKGGVGKTTTAAALAAGLHRKGYKVLTIDADTQGNISYIMGADTKQPGLYEALKGTAIAGEAIQATAQGDIMASSPQLSGADLEFKAKGWEYLLQETIKPVINNYHYIIIDTPPQLGVLTINALTAATDVIITLGADIFSLQGIAQLYDTINTIKRRSNPELKTDGILITRYNARTILSRDLKDSIQGAADHIGARLFKTVIREGIAIKEAQTLQEDIYTSAPRSNPAIDYTAFINEYLKTK